MVEPEKKELNKTADLEDTVRNLREENAKLLQLLRSQGLLLDPPSNGRSNESFPSTDTSQITFDHSDVTVTNNSVTTTNQINHQQITNHGSINQQNFNEQTIHGHQSNIAPNFNTVIQSTNQPFVQNNSNTLVQNNTNVIQPINLVNFNNVSLDSIHSFFASQNNLVYLSQTSATTTTTTTTTTTSSINTNLLESIPTNTQSILSSSEHQKSIRPKPSMLHPHQELVPVIPKMKTELYESLTKQYSSTTSNNDATTSLDNDSNDPKQKYPRPIRPKPSLRAHAQQNYKSMNANGRRSATSSLANNSSSTVSLFSSPSLPTGNYQSQSSLDHSTDHPPQLQHSKSLDLSVPSTTTNKKSAKTRVRNRKKPAASSATIPSNNPNLIPIAPNLGRPLAPTPSNISRTVTSNNPITKRTQRKVVKRNSKSLVQHHSESILQQNPSSPNNSFAESISGFLENFDQELMASNFLSQATVTTSNLLSDENHSLISSNTNLIQTFDHVNQTTLERHESFHSMPTMDEFNHRLEPETILTQSTITHDFNAEAEQITSFMSEEDMQMVEMNFDENTFLKQFDLDDAGIKFNVHSDQNLFANLLTTNTDLLTNQLPQQIISESSILPSNSQLSLPPPPPPLPVYPGSSLINNNVFTTVVPLGSQQTSQANTLITNRNVTRLLPEEGVQLTARHIEPSQVATYESVKYQDILDDLVMVTDQDALRHAQATAEGDPVMIASEFSFALLEATNEMIKNTNLEAVQDPTTTLTDLQFFCPLPSENILNQQQEVLPESQPQQQPIAILERLESQLNPPIDGTSNTLDESVINTSITDLSSILQFQSIQSPVNQDTSTMELITPVRTTKTISMKSPDQSTDLDSLLLPSKLPDSTQISDTVELSSNSLPQQSQSTEITMSPQPCILFEPISSSSNPPSPMKTSQNEMIIDSGRLDESTSEHADFINHDERIEELLRDSTNQSYEIIENQGQTCLKKHAVTTDINQLIEQIEPSQTDPKRAEILEQNFSRYQEKYQLYLQRQKKISSKKFQEQSSSIPLVKLKLNSIYAQQALKLKEERKSASPSPPPLPPSPLPSSSAEQVDEPPTPVPVERPPLKITIRTKLPTAISSPKEKTPNRKNRKSKKKKSHHHHQQQNSKKTKTIVDQLETEYAGLTRFERPLAQLYHQQSPPTSDETLPKDDNVISSVQAPLSRSESQSSSTLHSGFLIDEQTPPSSITSNEHKQSPPPLLLTQTKNEKVKNNYSHVFNYETQHEHQNNDTFVTPPPEIELNPQQQQKHHSYENFYSFSNSPNKQRHQQRQSSVTSSSSSRSITNTDYSIDTNALEPVSPTPISTSKPKHSRNSSGSLATYNEISPSYYEHQQTRPTKDYHSKKSVSSSSNRASRPTMPSQMYPQSRSLSNHTYRQSQEPPPPPPLLPPLLPPPPPSSAALHLDPYAQSYHHPFASQPPPPPAAAAAFFNFPFPHPFLNPHSTTAPSSHYHPPSHSHHHHHHSMKYSHHPHSHHHNHHHHHHSSHGYPSHHQQYSYHPHLQRQQQYNNSNYMSSRDHHSFDR